MKKFARAFAVGAVMCCLLPAGCSTTSTKPQPVFNTSYTAPGDWKLVEEWKWGIRFNVPPLLQDKGMISNSHWAHEGAKLRVIVDFNDFVPSEAVKAKPNYSETKIQFNGLPAVLCTYDRSANAAPGSFNKVVALFYLGSREVLGGQEPSYRVEFASDDQRATAVQILQTVRFFES